MTEGGKHFLVDVTLNYKAGDIEINSVSALFPKDNDEWLKWIQSGKAIWIDGKEKIQAIIDSQRTTNTMESERIGLNLEDTAKIVKNFENLENFHYLCSRIQVGIANVSESHSLFVCQGLAIF